jgi:hypothetical protein
MEILSADNGFFNLAIVVLAKSLLVSVNSDTLGIKSLLMSAAAYTTDRATFFK